MLGLPSYACRSGISRSLSPTLTLGVSTEIQDFLVSEISTKSLNTCYVSQMYLCGSRADSGVCTARRRFNSQFLQSSYKACVLPLAHAGIAERDAGRPLDEHR